MYYMIGMSISSLLYIHRESTNSVIHVHVHACTCRSVWFVESPRICKSSFFLCMYKVNMYLYACKPILDSPFDMNLR